MIILGLDFETTGLDVTQEYIIEVGAVLWEWERKKPLKFLSSFLNWGSHLKLKDETIEITGITHSDLKSYGQGPVEVFNELYLMSLEADYVMAHNGDYFDRPIYENNIKKINEYLNDPFSIEGIISNISFEEFSNWLPCIENPWLDSRKDIEYPSHIASRNLTTLAAEHGFLNPFPHRAITDVLTMLRVASNYSLESIIERSKSPELKILADVDFHTKDKAKSRGFYWDVAKKEWYLFIKEIDYEKIKDTFDFDVKIIKGEELKTQNAHA